METKTGTDKLSDPGAYDHVHCDQFGIDHEGKPISDHLTGTGSDAGPKEHDPDKPHKLTLLHPVGHSFYASCRDKLRWSNALVN